MGVRQRGCVLRGPRVEVQREVVQRPDFCVRSRAIDCSVVLEREVVPLPVMVPIMFQAPAQES